MVLKITNYETLENSILKSAEVAKFRNAKWIGNPWWDNYCSEAIKIKISLDNYVNFRSVRANTRKILRQRKRTNFQSFCENLNPWTSVDRVWKSIKRFKSSFSKILPVPTLGAYIPEQLLASFIHPFLLSLPDDAPRNTEKSWSHSFPWIMVHYQ